MKRLKVFLSVILLTLLIAQMPVLASGEQQRLTPEQVKSNFFKLFPEYATQMQACDEEMVRSAQYGVRALNGETNREINYDEEIVVTEKITRYDGDDKYELTLYSNGGYSEVALVNKSSNITFKKGSSDALKYMNCSVYATISNPGGVPYFGGIWGDQITYFKDGHFSATGHGNYIAIDFLNVEEPDPYFWSKTNTQVKVVGTAGIDYPDFLEPIEMVETMLTITLNAYADPTITFVIR